MLFVSAEKEPCSLLKLGMLQMAVSVIYAHDGKEIEKLISNMMPQVEHQFNEEGHKAFILVGIYSDERIYEYASLRYERALEWLSKKFK